MVVESRASLGRRAQPMQWKAKQRCGIFEVEERGEPADVKEVWGVMSVGRGWGRRVEGETGNGGFRSRTLDGASSSVLSERGRDGIDEQTSSQGVQAGHAGTNLASLKGGLLSAKLGNERWASAVVGWLTRRSTEYVNACIL